MEISTRMPKNAIEVRNLVKTYAGTRRTAPKQALKGVDLDVPAGSIFGLLGPNGAGKSTFINILAGLVVKTSGTVGIWGFDQDANPRHARAAIGVVPQELNIDPFFTPLESLEVQAGLYAVPKSERRSMEILTRLGLAEHAHAYTRSLSGGMRRRLLVAKALVHNPPVLVLDEPTAGVDIELRQQLWAYFRELNAAGTTIMLTTHYLEEAESLCRDVAIIDDGRIIEDAPMSTVLRKLQREVFVLSLSETMKEVPRLDNYEMLLREDNDLEVVIEPSHNLNDLFKQLNERNITVVSMRNKTNRLEELFMGLIEKKSDSAAKDPS